MDKHAASHLQPDKKSNQPEALSGILWIVGLYAVFAALWISASDWVLSVLIQDPVLMTTASTMKGWAFVAVTSLLLFVLLLRFTRRQAQAGPEMAADPWAGDLHDSGRPHHSGNLLVTFSVLAVLILLAGVGAVTYTFVEQKADILAQLKTIAGLKAGQVGNWLGERRRDAELVRTDAVFGEDIKRWRQTGDASTRGKIMNHMENLRRVMGYRSILLLDSEGRQLLAAGGASGGAPADVLRETAQRAAASGRVLFTDFYRAGDGGQEHIHLDFVSPLGAASGEAGLVIVLQIDAREFLYPYIQSWPLASDTAETVLFRREGDHVVFLNELRHRPGSALKLQVPMSRKDLLAVQAAEGRAKFGQPVEGIDYRSIPSLGVVQGVAGTEWHLVAKADQDELYAEVRKDAFWIGLADALALFATIVIGIIIHQRRELSLSLVLRREQAEKLRTMQLLESGRKAAEEALRASEQRWIMALDSAGHGVWDWNVPSRKAYFSRQWKAMLGYGNEEIGDDESEWSRRVHPEDLPGSQAELERHLRGETAAYRSEQRLRCKDGRYKWILSQGMVVVRDSSGNPVRVIGTHTDITSQKEAELELEDYRGHLEELVAARTREVALLNVELQKRATEAEAANRAKSAFLANMSHEIRTPLNAVLGFTHLLQRTALDGSQQEKLNRIAAAASHLLDVINSILDLSKIESGKLVLEETDFELQGVLCHVTSLLAPQAESKGLRLMTELPADPACRGILRGDPARLSQILLNYVGNAVKFTEQGSVTVRCRALEETGAAILLRFEVQDTGIGIAPEHLGRLFSAFEQADNSTTRKFGGTGLGLAINKQLARLMGGSIGVRSEPGGGSTFWFTARLAKSDQVPGQSRPTAAEDGKSASSGAMPPNDTGPLGETGMQAVLPANNVPRDREDAPGLSPRPGITVDLSIPGLDWQAGMSNLGGRRESYTRLLRQFAETHRDDGAALQSCLQAGDYQEALRLAHNLKGVAGTLGATEVQAAAAALDLALREQREAEEVARLGKRLESALDPVLKGILATLPAAGDHVEAVEVDPQALNTLLEQIENLAAEDSFAAQEAFREGLPLLRSALGAERAEELMRHVGNFDYREALAILQRVRGDYFGL